MYSHLYGILSLGAKIQIGTTLQSVRDDDSQKIELSRISESLFNIKFYEKSSESGHYSLTNNFNYNY